ncbi:hypothetical protein CSOJ01_13065, partial [Colletotrichum sojae]
FDAGDDASSADEAISGQAYRPLSKLRTLQQWKLEIVALFVSISSFIAIVVILKRYDGRPPPASSYLNINTTIAVFSTILRATIAYAAAQGRCNLCSNTHYVRHSILAIVGAFVVVATTAIGPFSQQAATTSSCCELSHEGSAEIKAVQRFEAGFQDGPTIASAVNGLVYGGADGSQTTLGLFKCICNSYADVSHSVQAFNRRTNETHYQFAENTNFRLAFPIRLHADSYALNMRLVDAPTPKQKSGYYQNATVSVMAFTAAGCPGTARTCDVTTVAANCTMYPCLRHYHSNVTNGIFQESVISQMPMELKTMALETQKDTSPLANYYYMKIIEPCRIGKDWYGMSNFSSARSAQTLEWRTWKADGERAFQVPSQCIRRISFRSYADFQNLLSETILGASKDTKGIDSPHDAASLAHRAYSVRCDKKKWWVSTMYGRGSSTFESISEAFDGMGAAISNRMHIMTLGSVPGRKTRTFVCIKAEWTWLVYPGSLLVLTVGLLVVASAQSYQNRGRLPVWKTAILPLLLYNVRRQAPYRKDSASAVPLLQADELESVADRTVARFSSLDGAPGFIVERNESDSHGIELRRR